MSTYRTAPELRAKAASLGFTSSPLIEELLATLEASETTARTAAQFEPKARGLRRALTITAVVAIAAVAGAVWSYTRWQSAAASRDELGGQLAVLRQAEDARTKTVSDTVAELRRVAQNAEAAASDTSKLFSKQLSQILDENSRLKLENEQLKAEVGTQKPVAAPSARN